VVIKDKVDAIRGEIRAGIWYRGAAMKLN